MENVTLLYQSLLKDLFDNVLPFTGPLEGTVVNVQLSDRVFEANGTFEQLLLLFEKAVTA